jgi:integrase
MPRGRRKSTCWSYSAGSRARGEIPSSKVRVYKRSDAAGLYLTRAWIKTASGRLREERLPGGLSREQAKALADKIAVERRQVIREGRGVVEEGSCLPATMDEVLRAYHDSADARQWARSHAVNQETYRRFWTDQLGESTAVLSLTPSRVRKVAQEAGHRRGWKALTERKYLAYLVAAIGHALTQERMIREDPLSGIKLPDAKADGAGLAYSEAEAGLLLTPHPEIDWRLTLAVNIEADTGRRAGAIRHLRTEDVSVRDGRIWMHFRGERDKRGHGALIPVSAKTAELVLDALEREEVRQSGWLFPGGHLGHRSPDCRWKKPIGAFDGLLRKAERVLGIPHVEGRATHGIKRVHVTVSWEEAGGDAALVGDVTGNSSPEVLRTTYRQQSEQRKLMQVDRVRARLEAARPENRAVDSRE